MRLYFALQLSQLELVAPFLKRAALDLYFFFFLVLLGFFLWLLLWLRLRLLLKITSWMRNKECIGPGVDHNVASANATIECIFAIGVNLGSVFSAMGRNVNVYKGNLVPRILACQAIKAPLVKCSNKCYIFYIFKIFDFSRSPFSRTSDLIFNRPCNVHFCGSIRNAGKAQNITVRSYVHVFRCAQHVLAYIVFVKQSSVVVVINNKCVGVVGIVGIVGGHFVNCLLSVVCAYICMNVVFYLYWF